MGIEGGGEIKIGVCKECGHEHNINEEDLCFQCKYIKKCEEVITNEEDNDFSNHDDVVDNGG